MKYDDDELDRIFFALSDRTRRALLEKLSECDSSVSDLAEPHEMSLQAVMKHISILAEAGLISVEKTGRIKKCHFEPEHLASASSWVTYYQKYWETQLKGLEDYLKEVKPNS